MIILSLLFFAPALFAATVLMDKIIVSGKEESSGLLPLMAQSGAVNMIAAFFLWGWMKITGLEIGFKELLPLALNGLTYWAGMLTYMAALKREEASRVAPIFQLLPGLGILADIFILRDTPTATATVGIFTVLFGCLLINYRRGRLNWPVICLMVFATIMLAVNDTVFARFGRGLSPASAIFADLTGKACIGLLPLPILRRTRQGFISGFRKLFWFIAISEVLTIMADCIVDLGKLYFPISVVQAIHCSQEFFMLIAVLILSRFLPKVLSEEVAGLSFRLKVIGIVVIVCGGIMIAVGQVFTVN